MRIGFFLPSEFAIGNPGNGIVAQARYQAQSLQAAGHTVVRMNPWDWRDALEFDVLHFFSGGVSTQDIRDLHGLARRPLFAFSPIIDSNQSFPAYRLAARLGAITPRIRTIPALMRDFALHSDVVICRSRHEQQRVIKGLGIAENKVEIVLNGCPPPTLVQQQPAPLSAPLCGLPEDFVLHISAFTQDRKNILRLAEAAGSLGYTLVIAGQSTPGPILDALQDRARAGQPIRILGYVDEPTKAALYGMCRVFCLPSIHEGTGLVAVEAAAGGARVVITRNGGPPDYFREFAQYVDPYDVPDIKRALSRAWNQPKNDWLMKHVTSQLTWERSAQALAAVYLKHSHASDG